MNIPDEPHTYELLNGEIVVWHELGGPIMLKSRNPAGDPVELSSDEARQLADLLAQVASIVEDDLNSTPD